MRFDASLCVLALLLVLNSPLSAQHGTEEIRMEVEEALGDYHLDIAQSHVNRIEQPGIRQFYQLNVWFYKYLGNQAPKYLDMIRDNWKTCINDLEAIEDHYPLARVMLAEIYTKRAMFEFLEQNYLTALRYAHSSRKQIKDAEEAYPNRPENKKVMGLMNVALGAVPKRYQWLTRALGYHGDITKGMEELKVASQKSTIVRTEALILYCYVEKNMLADPESTIKHLLESRENRKNPNILVDLFLASSYASVKNNDAVLNILSGRKNFAGDAKVFFIPYWDYLLAKAYYFKEDYPKSQFYFTRYLDTHQGSLFHTDATFRLGMAYTLGGDYATGKKYFYRLSGVKKSDLDEDAYAAYMAKKFYEKKPDEHEHALFRARNLYDGGYYKRARTVLEGLQSSMLPMSVATLTELFYRYGRINHSEGDLQEASRYYQFCISQEESDQLWLQAYSYYYLADIARQEGDLDKAKQLYKKALGFDDYFYQTGLENRCKVALRNLK